MIGPRRHPHRSAVYLSRVVSALVAIMVCYVSVGDPGLAQTNRPDQSEARIAAAMAHFERFRSSNSLADLRSASEGLSSAADPRTIKPSEIVARRRSIVSGFAQVLRQIELQTDPSFDATKPDSRPPGCLIPPEEPSGRTLPACADPNAISDPATRAKYVAAIKANNVKVERFNKSISLYNLDNETMLNMETVLHVFHARTPSDGPAIDNILRQTGLSEARRLKIDAMI
jgi:hypothetical protein